MCLVTKLDRLSVTSTCCLPIEVKSKNRTHLNYTYI